MKKLVEISVTIDSDLYEEASKLCTELETTIEEVIGAFFMFCAMPENETKVKEILITNW